ncbi:Alpha/Beta hydrolase protein [Favolaschia claudopus]|uniref:Alpha/Beta hydrolase protein n=1 Tax=Favolaschia claudopus TaxID=2862362 RepID=A0AAW0C2U2_9AGAR
MKQTIVIAGLQVHIHTTDDHATSSRPILALFALHGRLESSERMQDLISAMLESAGKQDQRSRDLIVVTFDQRNHGSRLQDLNANEDFKQNARHAIDMWTIQSGTAQDVSFLIDYLEAYLFPLGERTIVEWGVAGRSLGGHSAWMVAAADPRVRVVIPMIGSPDYLELIEPRAKSNGIAVAAPHFPDSLLKVIRSKSPAALPYTSKEPENPFLGKRILVLSGGAADKLVPWAASQTFVEELEVGPTGSKEYIVFEGVGHAVPPEMLSAAVDFVMKAL